MSKRSRYRQSAIPSEQKQQMNFGNLHERHELAKQVKRRVIAAEGSNLLHDERRLKSLIAEQMRVELGSQVLSLGLHQEIVDDIYNEMKGLDILQPLMEDRRVTEIMVNGPKRIFIEADGRLRQTELSFRDQAHLSDVITHFFSQANRALNYRQPIADMRLPDGSRANAVLPPVATDGPIFTIRKFTGIKLSGEALIATDFITRECLDYLGDAIRQRESIMISGGTGSGKTTLLNVLSSEIPARERVVTIEDSSELQLQGHENLVRLEARLPGPDGSGQITIADLIKTALRMRPDRIIVGEVRGAEAYDLLSSMNTGHPGTLCTGHANSCRDMVSRLANLVLHVSNLPYETILREVAAAVHILVHIRRTSEGKREISEVYRLYPDDKQIYRLEAVFLREMEGSDLVYQTTNQTPGD